jgi:hypothetical protein
VRAGCWRAAAAVIAVAVEFIFCAIPSPAWTQVPPDTSAVAPADPAAAPTVEMAPSPPPAPAGPPDTILVKKGFFGTSYRYAGKKLKSGDDFKTVYGKVNDPEPRRLFDQSKRWEVASYLTGIPGGILLGSDLGRRWSGREGNSTVLAAGLGLSAVSTVFDLAHSRAKKRAARTFNARVREQAGVSLQLLPPATAGEWVRVGARF